VYPKILSHDPMEKVEVWIIWRTISLAIPMSMTTITNLILYLFAHAHRSGHQQDLCEKIECPSETEFMHRRDLLCNSNACLGPQDAMNEHAFESTAILENYGESFMSRLPQITLGLLIHFSSAFCHSREW
jgi:hypothetical protein